jgi:hypothetical protein
MILPKLKITGHTGSWFAAVEGYDDIRLSCVHAQLRRDDGTYCDRPLRMGTDYRKKTDAYIERFIENIEITGIVVVTKDKFGSEVSMGRTGYEGLWTVRNVRRTNQGLELDFVKQIAEPR